MERRICEISENESWRKINFKLLLKGDKFRLTDPPGKLVIDNKGNTEFIASCDAFETENGIPIINIEET